MLAITLWMVSMMKAASVKVLEEKIDATFVLSNLRRV